MEYIADTVTVIRHLSDSGEIGKHAKQILEDTDKGKSIIYISAITLAEVLYLSEKNRIKIDLQDIKKKIIGSNNYRIIDLTFDIVEEAKSVKLNELHDRLIVATAKHFNLPILTSDKIITDSKIVKVIWK
ncbi:MAG TPA: hypothetical protein DC049_08625 [Spirochaetia bacterium]|nr:hypothetical protein [Spirochaetia bacterium]